MDGSALPPVSAGDQVTELLQQFLMELREDQFEKLVIIAGLIVLALLGKVAWRKLRSVLQGDL